MKVTYNEGNNDKLAPFQHLRAYPNQSHLGTLQHQLSPQGLSNETIDMKECYWGVRKIDGKS